MLNYKLYDDVVTAGESAPEETDSIFASVTLDEILPFVFAFIKSKSFETLKRELSDEECRAALARFIEKRIPKDQFYKIASMASFVLAPEHAEMINKFLMYLGGSNG